MVPKTLLFDLPNELFRKIFHYLSAGNVVQGFLDFKIRRIQNLIRPFICRLDISQESDEWIQKYLPNLFDTNEMLFLRLKLDHFLLLYKYLSAANIHCIEMTDWHSLNKSQEYMLESIHENFRGLSLIQPKVCYRDDIANILFRSKSKIEHLKLLDSPIALLNCDIPVCNRLTQLEIELFSIHSVFMLVNHLSNLQDLKVNMHGSDSHSNSKPITDGIELCKTLHSVIFTGYIEHFDHIESFFVAFGRTIEYLSLNIRSKYQVFDGKRLEFVLLDNMPRLSALNMIISSELAENGDPIEIETFHSAAWQTWKPVVYFYDIHTRLQLLCTLPYEHNSFEYFSNDYVATCVSNRSVSICFERVRKITLTNTTPLELHTFLFIQAVFPHLTTVGLEFYDSTNQPHVAVMNDDLLLENTNSLQLRSVRKFRICLKHSYDDYKSFRRFLQIFPNLIDLELPIKQSFLQDILKYGREDKFIKSALARIERLNLIFMEGKNAFMDADIKYLFPKADYPLTTFNHVTK